jgi:hypothetical protein
MKLLLTLLKPTFTIYRLDSQASIPVAALASSFMAVTRTDDELSLVLPDSIEIEGERSDSGWACFKVDGPLEFGLVGILAGISSTLAKAEVSIFAISTFDTDYILVKRKQVEAAYEALVSDGYSVQ